MMAFLTLSAPLQATILIVVGLVLGMAANWGIYRFAWFPRDISPWSKRHADAGPGYWYDRLPVLGWLFLRRDEKLHGSFFWVRPLLIEVACAVGLWALFRHELAGGTLPPSLRLEFSLPPLKEALLGQFVSHALLFWGLMVATFIDFDEQTIPDSVTVTGALLGMFLSVLLPVPLMPVAFEGGITFCGAVSYGELPAWMLEGKGLALCCCIVLAWGFALVPALCTLRRGLWKGIAFYWATFFRGGYAYWLLAIASMACVGMSYVWFQWPAAKPALVSSVIGLGFGGGLVWAVRIIGQIALRKEAMGFGDVTLMAMIGAFLGWQAALIVFFLSPVAALFVSLAQWIFSGRRDIAFGPYLSLAAVMVVVGWDRVWNNFAREIFSLGSLVPQLLGLGLILMLILLASWRAIEQRFFGDAPQ